MTQRSKKFRKWETNKSPLDCDEVESLLRRIFNDRFSVRSGSSHQFMLDLHELIDSSDFPFGNLSFPVKKSQSIKAYHLQLAYKAAVQLELFAPEEDESDDD